MRFKWNSSPQRLSLEMSRNSLAATRVVTTGTSSSQSNAGPNEADNPAQNNPVDGNSVNDVLVLWKQCGQHGALNNTRMSNGEQHADISIHETHLKL